MTTLAQVADKAQLAIADSGASTWPQATIEAWVIDAIRDFPLKRSLVQEFTATAGVHTSLMPADYLGIVAVEYPAGQDPPQYLRPYSHFKPEFWESDGYYDVSRSWGEVGLGTPDQEYTLWISASPAAGEKLKAYYLADHDLALVSADPVTVPDRYLDVLVLYCVAAAWKERFGAAIQSGITISPTINELSLAVRRAEEAYQARRAQVIAEWQPAAPTITPAHKLDQYDRIY
jgi:hypothetical protein